MVVFRQLIWWIPFYLKPYIHLHVILFTVDPGKSINLYQELEDNQDIDTELEMDNVDLDINEDPGEEMDINQVVQPSNSKWRIPLITAHWGSHLIETPGKKVT